jgi:hypothetical protein
MRPFGSLFAKPGLGEPGGLYDAREACRINEIDLGVEWAESGKTTQAKSRSESAKRCEVIV